MAGPVSSVTLGVGDVDGGLVVGLPVGLGVGEGVGLGVGDAVGDLVGGIDTGLLVGLGVDLCAEMGVGLAFDWTPPDVAMPPNLTVPCFTSHAQGQAFIISATSVT